MSRRCRRHCVRRRPGQRSRQAGCAAFSESIMTRGLHVSLLYAADIGDRDCLFRFCHGGTELVRQACSAGEWSRIASMPRDARTWTTLGYLVLMLPLVNRTNAGRCGARSACKIVSQASARGPRDGWIESIDGAELRHLPAERARHELITELLGNRQASGRMPGRGQWLSASAHSRGHEVGRRSTQLRARMRRRGASRRQRHQSQLRRTRALRRATVAHGFRSWLSR